MLILSRTSSLCKKKFFQKTWSILKFNSLNKPRLLSTVLEPSDDWKHFKPRRACLYTPGDDESKLLQNIASKADCLIFDCEDGVASSRKVILISYKNFTFKTLLLTFSFLFLRNKLDKQLLNNYKS